MSEGPYKLPKGWRWVRLGEVAEVRGGIAFPPKYQGRIHGKFPFYKVSDMNLPGNQIVMGQSTNWIDDSLVPLIGAKPFASETIIFPKVGGAIYTNKKRLLRVESFIDNNLMGVTVFPHSRCYPRFLFYWFGTINLRDLSNPGPLPSINAARVKSLSLPLPPLPEQHRIVARIGELMGRIQKARRLREEAKQDAERLWQAVLAQTFPRPGTELPKGWRWVRLGEVVSVERQATKPSSLPEEFPFVGLEHIEPHTGIVDVRKCPSVRTVSSQVFVYDRSHVLYSKLRPYLNKVYVPEEEGACSTELVPLKPKPDEVDRYFLAWYLRSPDFVAYASAHTNGTRQPRVSLSALETVQVPLPPLPEQRRIVAYLEAVQERIRALKEAQKATEVALKDLEQAILERAFRGEL